jgi:hypothetical protein
LENLHSVGSEIIAGAPAVPNRAITWNARRFIFNYPAETAPGKIARDEAESSGRASPERATTAAE